MFTFDASPDWNCAAAYLAPFTFVYAMFLFGIIATLKYLSYFILLDNLKILYSNVKIESNSGLINLLLFDILISVILKITDP